jgi:hypothetical protein
MEMAVNQRQGGAGSASVLRVRGERSLKRRPCPQLLVRAELDGRTLAAKTFDKLVADIISDLGGEDACTTLEVNLVQAYAGASLQVETLNCRQLIGEQIDLTAYCQAASTMTRIASRLGLRRRPKPVNEMSLSSYLANLAAGETKPGGTKDAEGDIRLTDEVDA